MNTQIILFVGTVLVSIIGFLCVRLLDSINKSIKILYIKFDKLDDKFNHHEHRITVLETEHEENH